MNATLVVDMFGSLSPIPERVARDPDDLYPDKENPLDGYLWGVFLPRSEMMGWSNSRFDGTALLWNVEEAELTYHIEESRIGFTQVGLNTGIGELLDQSGEAARHIELSESEIAQLDLSQAEWAPYPIAESPATDPAVVIPPLVQCSDDSIRWFGEAELSAVQVTGIDVTRTKRPYAFESTSVLNWFNTQSAEPKAHAVVTILADGWDDGKTTALADENRRWHSGSLEFGALVSVPEDYVPRPAWMRDEWAELDAKLGIPVLMPEWDASSIGWIIARVFDLVLALDSAPGNLAVRVTRLDE